MVVTVEIKANGGDSLSFSSFRVSRAQANASDVEGPAWSTGPPEDFHFREKICKNRDPDSTYAGAFEEFRR